MGKISVKFLLLIILYLGFISLGLPDKGLDVAWPFMRRAFGQPLENAGILVSLTAILTAFSGFVSGWFMRRCKIVTILSASCFLTAAGLYGYAFSPTWAGVILATVPLGLGAGAIDASLNNYVAENYSSRHMNWLHACWGIGAAGGSALMAAVIALGRKWNCGYIIIASLQVFLLALFILSRNLWNTAVSETAADIPKTKLSAKFYLFCSAFVFFIYSAVETSIGLWFYSMMVEKYRFGAARAGSLIVVYWSLLTFGRLVIGSFANRIGNRRIISLGLLGTLGGLGLLFSPNYGMILCGLAIIGFSMAGIYPSMMHETPRRFGQAAGRFMTGFQAGAASLGVALLTPLAGVFISHTSFAYLLPLLAVLTILMLAAVYLLDRHT